MTDTQELVLIRGTLHSMAEAIADFAPFSGREENKEPILRKLLKSLQPLTTYIQNKEAEEAQEQYEQHRLEERKKEVKKIQQEKKLILIIFHHFLIQKVLMITK